MPAIACAFILLAIGAGVNALLWFAVVPAIFDISDGAKTGMAIACMIFAAVYGFITGLARVYVMRPRSLWVFVLDVTWSMINTISGLGFMIYCLVKGTYETPNETTQDRGIIRFSGAALPGAGATTLGNVMGGKWLVHETVHVQQARIFGPFYWPVYLVNYVMNLIARFLTGRFTDPHWEAYGRVIMEDWAYRAAPDSAAKVLVLPSLLWFALTFVNALALGVLIASIPVIGALPDLFGLDVLPWWLGLIVLVAYALVRSFFAKAQDSDDDHAAPAGPVFT